MVEKEEASYDGASTVMVDAIETSPANTVGAAINILEEKLAAKGIFFQVPAGTPKSGLGKVDGKLLRLPILIELAITHAIDTTEKATDKNVAEEVTGSVQEALVPGNVVALRQCGGPNRFLVVSDGRVSSSRFNSSQLPLEGNSERFLVVDAGSGCIALYCPTSRRFLGFQNGAIVASGYPLINLDESPRANESFQVVGGSSSELLKLDCPIDTPKSAYEYGLFKIYGFD